MSVNCSPGVEFVHDAVTGIDPDEETVSLADGNDLEYDYLVVATGHRLDPSAMPGLTEAWEEHDDVYPFYHYEAALEMREALENFDGGTFLVTQPDTPIKCPGAPLKLTMLAEDYFRRQGIRDDVEVVMSRNAEHHFGFSPTATNCTRSGTTVISSSSRTSRSTGSIPMRASSTG